MGQEKLLEKLHDIFEWPFMIFFLVGVLTAAFNVTWGGFTPLIWLMVALLFLLCIICFEVTLIRLHLKA